MRYRQFLEDSGTPKIQRYTTYLQRILFAWAYRYSCKYLHSRLVLTFLAFLGDGLGALARGRVAFLESEHARPDVGLGVALRPRAADVPARF